MTKRNNVLEKIKDCINSNIYSLQLQFNNNNSTVGGESKDYGHIATQIVILKQVIGWIESIEEDYIE